MRIRKVSLMALVAGIIFLFISCDRYIRNDFAPVTLNINDEVMSIIYPQGRVLRNLVVRDTSDGRIVLSLASLDQNRIIVLPQGEYEFSADGISGTLDLQEDSRVVAVGNNFRGEPLREPARIVFRRGNNLPTNNLSARGDYYLTIFDLDGLGLPVSAYTAVLARVGGTSRNIDLRTVKENNRIISVAPIHFPQRGDYVLTITANGISDRIGPLRFSVLDPPFAITVNNLWRGAPLQYAEMEFFRLEGNDLAEIRRRGNLVNNVYVLDNNAYLDISRRAGRQILSRGPHGEPFVYTGSNGRIVIPNVHHGQSFALAVSGYQDFDPGGTNQLSWYVRTITANANNRNPSITWNIPSKGGRRGFTAFARPSIVTLL